MNFTNREKELLLGNAPVRSRITLYDENGDVIQIFTEEDYLVDWELEDYRYVPDQGFIGQFVERLLDGHLLNIPEDISLENKEIDVELAVVDNELEEQVYHNYGRFIITQINKEDASGSYRFQSSDYTKKFNVPYVSDVTYPCTALDLLNSVCKQVNVSLDDDDGNAICFSSNQDGLPSGNYYFKLEDSDNTTSYYKFTLDRDLHYMDSLILSFDDEEIYQRTISSDYEVSIDTIEYSVDTTLDSSYTEIVGNYVQYYDFVNNGFVIGDNQFEENDTCRSVICAIAKLAYGWARIDENNNLCIDFTKKDSVDTYDIIDTDKYYEVATTGDTILAVNKVLIGMSNVDGENIYATSETYTEETESMIAIYDNPLTHSEELRRIAINGCDKLYGISYTPLSVQTIGHPWLQGDELIKLTNLSEDDLYFYPFDRKIKYNGVLTTDISAQAENKIEQKYENKNTVIDRLHHTEIDVNKAENDIKLISSRIDGNVNDITTLQVNIDGINQTVEHIENSEITGLQKQITNINTSMNNITNLFQVTGGINLIRNSAFLLRDNVWTFTDGTGHPYHTPLGGSYNSDVLGKTVSVSEIKLEDVTVKSTEDNITNLKNDGTQYTLNFYYKQDANTTTTIKLYNTENNNIKAFNDIVITGAKDFSNYEVSFTPSSNNYTLEITTSSGVNNGYFYLYDLILNAGDKQTWQPASDEIYSTTLTMSRLGLQVYSTGDGTITVLGSEGMLTYETSDGKTLGDLVRKNNVTGDNTIMLNTNSVSLGTDISNDTESKWVETTIVYGGALHKITYLKESE